MNWAARRRFIILLIVGAVAAAFFTVVLTATFYDTPSCTDGAQNQDETGIDCGGSCAYLCAAQLQPPTVLFTKSFQNNAGRTDIIASVENKNVSAAAKDVSYTITLYGAGQSLIQKVSGTFDLPPGASTPIYVPGITSGKQMVTQAFLTIDSSSLRWFPMTASERRVPLVLNTIRGGTPDAPRIETMLSNPTITPFHNVKVVVLVHDARGEVIAASQTLISSIPAQGQAVATFTWNSAFSETPATIETVPIMPLLTR